jgi:hypothetical protein
MTDPGDYVINTDVKLGPLERVDVGATVSPTGDG